MILDRVRRFFGGPRAETPASMTFDQLREYLFGAQSDAGTFVNDRTAMAVSAVYACVSLIGGAIAGLPLKVYRQNGDERESIKPPLWWLLNEEAAPMWAAANFWEYMAWSRLMHGDGFARIVRKSVLSPDVAAIVPIHPLNVEPTIQGDRLVYVLFNGTSREGIDQDDMLHFPSPGFDGRRSPSPIQYAVRNAAGIALAADEYSAAFFKNGARPDYFLTAPQGIKDDARDKLREQWMQRYGGAKHAHMPAILTGGLDVKQITMSNEDATLIETRAFQVEDVARIYGVPPFMIGHTEKTTSWGSGVESMSIGFVKYTLSRHLVKIEQELNRKLFKTARNFVEFNVEGLLRADAKTRADYYGRALGGSAGPGWMSQDEVRRLENLPLKGGDAGKLTQWSAKDASKSPDPVAG
jgi:HK97 family phage portal protein